MSEAWRGCRRGCGYLTAVVVGGILLLALLGLVLRELGLAPERSPSSSSRSSVRSEAEQWADRVRNARLDETTLSQFSAQMPPESAGVRRESREASCFSPPCHLIVTWTWEDGSEIEARFQWDAGDRDYLLFSVDGIGR